MMQLPHGITAPLHIFPWWIKYIIWAVFLVPAVFLYLKYIRPYLKRRITSVLKSNPIEMPVPSGDIHKIIDGILKRNKGNKTYRSGLFELSKEMKFYLEKKTGADVEEMTGCEIKKKFASDEPGNFFIRLEEISYRSEEPVEKGFIDMCMRAGKVIRGKISIK